MKQYDFNAIEILDKKTQVVDRWRLEAESYREACEMAQEIELESFVDNGLNPTSYDFFELLAVS